MLWDFVNLGDIKMTISEVSKKYELSSDTLRYYERIGLLQEIKADCVILIQNHAIGLNL